MGIFKNIFDADTRVWNSEMSGYFENCVARLNANDSEGYKKIGNALISFTYGFSKTTAAPDKDNRIISVKFSELPQGSASALARIFAGYAVGVLALKVGWTDKELSTAFARILSEIMDLRACDVHLAQDLISAEDPSLSSAPSKMFTLVCDLLGHSKVDLAARLTFELMLQSWTIFLHDSAFGKSK